MVLSIDRKCDRARKIVANVYAQLHMRDGDGYFFRFEDLFINPNTFNQWGSMKLSKKYPKPFHFNHFLCGCFQGSHI